MNAKAKAEKGKKKAQVDKGTYEATKPYLKAALEHLLQTGRTVKDFLEFAVGRFGGAIVPYVKKFEQEVREGTVKVAGVTKSTKDAVLGKSPFETGKAALNALKTTAEKEVHVVKDVVSDWVAGRGKGPAAEAKGGKAAAKKAAPKKKAAAKKAAPKKKAAKKKAVAKKAAPKKKAAAKKAAPKKKAATKKAAPTRAAALKTAASAGSTTPAKTGESTS